MSKKEILNPMQIAVYAVNCSNSDEYMSEVKELIDLYAESLADKAFVAGRSKMSWEQFKKDNGLDRTV